MEMPTHLPFPLHLSSANPRTEWWKTHSKNLFAISVGPLIVCALCMKSASRQPSAIICWAIMSCSRSLFSHPFPDHVIDLAGSSLTFLRAAAHLGPR